MKTEKLLQNYIKVGRGKKKALQGNWLLWGHLQIVLDTGRKQELLSLVIVLRQIRSNVLFLWQLF